MNLPRDDFRADPRRRLRRGQPRGASGPGRGVRALALAVAAFAFAGLGTIHAETDPPPAASTAPPKNSVPEPTPTAFVYAMSPETFAEVNENDGKAAMKAWGRILLERRHLTNEIVIRILERNALVRGVAEGQVDAVTVSAEDYFLVRPWIDLSSIHIGSAQGENFEEFVLLVHTESGFTNIANLQSRSLLIFDGARASLAPKWLDRLLLEQGLPRTSEHFGNTTGKHKLSATVLPVFFKSTDACLATRRGFEIMAELNPQLGKRLKVLARSGPFVPVVFCVRKNYPASIRNPILEEIGQLQSSAAGQQLLTLFQTERMDHAEESCLEAARELLEAHARLLARPPGSAAPPNPTSAPAPAATTNVAQRAARP